MKHRGITLIEWIVILATFGILAAILFPVFSRNRPAHFHAAVVPPQQFNGVPLRLVMASLDQDLQAARAAQGKKPVKYLQRIVWGNEDLKSRRVTMSTLRAMPLRRVLDQLEATAKIKI